MLNIPLADETHMNIHVTVYDINTALWYLNFTTK